MRSASRHLAFVLCLVGAVPLCVAQEWTPQGSITSRQYENQIREGGQVVATDFITLEYSVDTWIEDVGNKKGPHMNCDNKCKGKVHEEHSKCDYSCDVRCVETHRTTVRGEYRPDRAAMNAATRAANGLALQGGGTHSPSDWSHRVSSALASFRADARKSKTFTMPHAGACSGADKWVGTKTFNFHVRGTMKKTGYRMSRGVRTPINEVVGMHESVVASADIMQEDPFSDTAWTKCLCKGKDKPFDYSEAARLVNEAIQNALQGFDEIKNSILSSTGGLIMQNMAGEFVDPGESKVTVLPKDMNACVVQVENGTGQDVRVTIPVGTTFEAVNGNDQDMSSNVLATGLLYAGEKVELHVSLRPQQRQTTADFGFRWACVNMNKKAPTPTSKYVMHPPKDDVLIALGKITNSARIRGPQDQARTWIYTDKATLTQINDKLFPSISEGRYMTLLWEIATQGGVDFASSDYRRCLDPKLLSGVPINDSATAWLVSMLTETRARDLARYVEGNIATIVRSMESDPQYGPGHVATLATAMLSEENADVRKAGMRLVTTMPAALREQFAEAGGLAGVRNLVTSGTASEVSSAVDALILYKANDLLGACWEQLPTETLKTKAKKQLGIE